MSNKNTPKLTHLYALSAAGRSWIWHANGSIGHSLPLRRSYGSAILRSDSSLFRQLTSLPLLLVPPAVSNNRYRTSNEMRKNESIHSIQDVWLLLKLVYVVSAPKIHQNVRKIFTHTVKRHFKLIKSHINIRNCYGSHYNNNCFMALCPGPSVPGWASTRRIHSPTHQSWSSTILYQLSPSTTIDSNVPVQFTCLTVSFAQVLFGLPLGMEPSTSYSIHFVTQFTLEL